LASFFSEALRSRAAKYFLVGAFCATVDLAVFLLLQVTGLNPIPSTVIGYCSGTLLSFLLNRSLTFKVLDKPIRRLALFFGTGLAGLTLSALLMFLGQLATALSPELIKALSIPPVAVFQYLLNKKLTFK
jgi:putative flippase GtrA